jgi:hypothetical protein
MTRGLLIALIVIVVLAGGVAAWAVSVNNQLVVLDQSVAEKWAQVQNVYQRRADLVPNLVETVKGFAAQERTVLEEVTRARASAKIHMPIARSFRNNPPLESCDDSGLISQKTTSAPNTQIRSAHIQRGSVSKCDSIVRNRTAARHATAKNAVSARNTQRRGVETKRVCRRNRSAPYRLSETGFDAGLAVVQYWGRSFRPIRPALSPNTHNDRVRKTKTAASIAAFFIGR